MTVRGYTTLHDGIVNITEDIALDNIRVRETTLRGQIIDNKRRTKHWENYKEIAKDISSMR